MKFVIIDRQTKLQVGGEYATYKRAKGKADRLDNAYGGYRYYVKEMAA